MKKRRLINPIVVYILAQLAWFALLALWIYWYITNYLIFIDVGERISPQFVMSTKNIAALVGGIVLLVGIAVAMALIYGRLNQQLKVNKNYDSFIANVTHELKSPLASIQLYLETMGSRDVPFEKRKEFINLMLRDSQRLNALINSILEISGLEDKKKVFQFKYYDADELVHQLIGEAAEQYNLPKGAVRIVGGTKSICKVDRRALKIILNNLFDNAVKYSIDPVDITVKISDESNKLILEVSDQGIGIPEKDQREVFKKFRRISSSISPTVKGTGLGLYWVRELIRHHRGKVNVYSEGQNKGTTFTIELPTHPGSSALTEAKEESVNE